VEIDRGTAKFDLSLSMIDVGGDLFGSCEYNTDLFDLATVVRMQEQFGTLLAGIVEAPDRRIAALPLLPGGQRRQVLADWNATAALYPHDRCVHEIFEIQALRTPDAPAVAEVVDLIDKPAGTVVHLRILPGAVGDYAAAAGRSISAV